MSNGPRIGVFGGTFDPPHRTHLAIARAARDQARLDKILFVISGDPPHKRGEVAIGAEDRLAMVEAAIAGEPGLEACRLEMDRHGPSYTIDTLNELAALYPGGTLYLIIGYDSLLELHRWRQAKEIVQRARLLVAPRADLGASPESPFSAHAQLLDMPPTPVSSTEIRDRLQRGEAPDEWLPPGVLRVIRERGLYHVHD